MAVFVVSLLEAPKPGYSARATGQRTISHSKSPTVQLPSGRCSVPKTLLDGLGRSIVSRADHAQPWIIVRQINHPSCSIGKGALAIVATVACWLRMRAA